MQALFIGLPTIDKWILFFSHLSCTLLFHKFVATIIFERIVIVCTVKQLQNIETKEKIFFADKKDNKTKIID